MRMPAALIGHVDDIDVRQQLELLGGEPRHAGEITLGIVRQFARKQIDGVARPVQQRRVRICGGTHDQFGRDHGAAAGTVFHHDLLPQRFDHRRRQQTAR